MDTYYFIDEVYVTQTCVDNDVSSRIILIFVLFATLLCFICTQGTSIDRFMITTIASWMVWQLYYIIGNKNKQSWYVSNLQ
jgi:hypothetical protein